MADLVPYRMAFAGGWIDQPFVSRLNPDPPGSMVVVGLEPTITFMERAGMATGTRKVARRLWGDALPARDPSIMVRELYEEENRRLPDPSGSQDMIGIIYPGVNRLDFDANHEGGVFPCRIETCCTPEVCAWIERMVQMLPVAPRPAGYNPLGTKRLDPAMIRRLGRSGRDCYAAILRMDAAALGASMNESMACWESLLPDILHHHTLTHDLVGILRAHQCRSHGAMYSGCGGGYLYIVAEQDMPGAFRIRVRR